MDSRDELPAPDVPADAPEAPTPPAARGLSVPATLWIWLAVLALSFAAPYLGGPKRVAEEAARETGLTTKSFQTLLQGELFSRLYLLYRTRLFADALKTGGAAGGGAAGSVDTFAKRADEAYRRVAEDAKGPNAARKVVVLGGLREKPFDEEFVEKTLLPNLRDGAQLAPPAVRAEAALWRALYGRDAPPPGDVASAEERLRGMRLGIYEDAALRTLYERAGQAEKAAAAQKRLDGKALSQGVRILAMNLFLFGAGLGGVLGLILFGIAWRTGKWHYVARVPTQPQGVTWGGLLDTFVFYLAAYRGAGLLLPLLDPSGRMSVVASAALVQAATGFAAIWYGMWRAGQCGTTLADIGLRTKNLVADVFYGVAAYGAALPVLFVLSQINQFLFRNNTSATPNPVLPLLAAEQDAVLRMVIFLLVAVGAPLFEEVFFRGFLYSALRVRFAWVGSAVISGILFAMMHPPSDWLPIFGLGFVLAAVREMRQSVVPGIVTHFLQNSMAYFLMSTLFGG